MKRSLLHVTLVALMSGAMAGTPALTWAADKEADKPATPPAAKTEDKGEQAAVSKFYGTVSAVDTKAMTFTIDKETYSVVPETHMTLADGDKPATLTDSVVGQPARGSYTKSADGKMNVTKVRFGKKTGGKSGGKSGGKKGDAAATDDASKGSKDAKDSKSADAPAAPAEK